MRLGVAVGLLIGLGLVLAPRDTALACTGCSDPFSTVAGPAKAIALVTVDRAPAGSVYDVRVDETFKGRLPARLAYEPNPLQEAAVGSRCLLVINADGFGKTPLIADYAWRLLLHGSITDVGLIEVPASIVALRAWFQMPATDVVDPAPGPHRPSAPSSLSPDSSSGAAPSDGYLGAVNRPLTL